MGVQGDIHSPKIDWMPHCIMPYPDDCVYALSKDSGYCMPYDPHFVVLFKVSTSQLRWPSGSDKAI